MQSVENYLLMLQSHICNELMQFEQKARFCEDNWTRPDGGFGKTCVLQEGNVFEKAGVNFSHIMGKSLPNAATMKHPEFTGGSFRAMGLSLVIHPRNPYVPTAHCNVRFFSVFNEQKEIAWWFGGGFDLTPYYGFAEDCIHWHKTAKAACMPFGELLYDRFKKACDAYFYLPHREEPRGIGGLFFDDFTEGGFEKSFAFMQSVGNHFLQGYKPIVERRYELPYDEEARAFQRYRRGRYVEFNLIYDRGTLFGLQYGGRIESILMSLPPEAGWFYRFVPRQNSKEAKLIHDFFKPRDWLNPDKVNV